MQNISTMIAPPIPPEIFKSLALILSASKEEQDQILNSFEVENARRVLLKQQSVVFPDRLKPR